MRRNVIANPIQLASTVPIRHR